MYFLAFLILVVTIILLGNLLIDYSNFEIESKKTIKFFFSFFFVFLYVVFIVYNDWILRRTYSNSSLIDMFIIHKCRLINKSESQSIERLKSNLLPFILNSSLVYKLTSSYLTVFKKVPPIEEVNRDKIYNRFYLPKFILNPQLRKSIKKIGRAENTFTNIVAIGSDEDIIKLFRILYYLEYLNSNERNNYDSKLEIIRGLGDFIANTNYAIFPNTKSNFSSMLKGKSEKNFVELAFVYTKSLMELIFIKFKEPRLLTLIISWYLILEFLLLFFTIILSKILGFNSDPRVFAAVVSVPLGAAVAIALFIMKENNK